jgi:hypothetical protein
MNLGDFQFLFMVQRQPGKIVLWLGIFVGLSHTRGRLRILLRSGWTALPVGQTLCRPQNQSGKRRSFRKTVLIHARPFRLRRVYPSRHVLTRFSILTIPVPLRL